MCSAWFFYRFGVYKIAALFILCTLRVYLWRMIILDRGRTFCRVWHNFYIHIFEQSLEIAFTFICFCNWVRLFFNFVFQVLLKSLLGHLKVNKLLITSWFNLILLILIVIETKNVTGLFCIGLNCLLHELWNLNVSVPKLSHAKIVKADTFIDSTDYVAQWDCSVYRQTGVIKILLLCGLVIDDIVVACRV